MCFALLNVTLTAARGLSSSLGCVELGSAWLAASVVLALLQLSALWTARGPRLSNLLVARCSVCCGVRSDQRRSFLLRPRSRCVVPAVCFGCAIVAFSRACSVAVHASK